MKRDAIFYQIFQRFPSLLFSLINQPPDNAQEYRFESIEVKEPNFRIDGVFLPPENASPKIVYFAEFQFQPDEYLYDRLFSEAHLYLYRNRSVYDDWYGVVIYPSRKLEPKNTTIHRSLLTGSQVKRIYLDELGDPNNQSIGVGLMQLTIASESLMSSQAKQLLERVELEGADILSRKEIIDVITTIAVYKFQHLKRNEVEEMLGLALQETQVYKDVERETRIKVIRNLMKKNFSLEDISEIVEMSVEEIQHVISEDV